MIIISQDKKTTINFDNVFSLYVDTWSSEEWATEPDCWCIKAEKAQDNLICVFLGEYKTEERAKEVLKEIINEYKKSYQITQNNLSYLNAVPMPTIYEMPKK